MANFKQILVNLSLACMSVTIGLALCEVAIRMFMPQQIVTANGGIWRPDSVLGWQHQEDIVRDVNTGERGAVFVSDERGYRVNGPGEFATPANPEFRIIALGDSFVEGLMVDGEETFAKVLERRLVEAGLKAEVVNSGVSGWNPYHYLLKTEHVLRHEPIDLGLVFLYVANDIISPGDTLIRASEIARIASFRIPRSASRREIIDALLKPANDYLERHSHTFVLAKNRAAHILGRLGLSKQYFPDVFALEQADSPRWRFTASLCKRIVDAFERERIPVAFVLVPASYQVHEAVFHDYVSTLSIPVEDVDLRQPNRQLQTMFESYVDAPLIDLLDPLKEQALSNVPLYGEIDRHLNEAGHRAVAEALFPIVHRSLQFDAETSAEPAASPIRFTDPYADAFHDAASTNLWR